MKNFIIDTVRGIMSFEIEEYDSQNTHLTDDLYYLPQDDGKYSILIAEGEIQSWAYDQVLEKYWGAVETADPSQNVFIWQKNVSEVIGDVEIALQKTKEEAAKLWNIREKE